MAFILVRTATWRGRNDRTNGFKSIEHGRISSDLAGRVLTNQALVLASPLETGYPPLAFSKNPNDCNVLWRAFLSATGKATGRSSQTSPSVSKGFIAFKKFPNSRGLPASSRANQALKCSR